MRWSIFDEMKCVGAVVLYRDKDKPLLRVELDSTDDAEALTEASLHAQDQLRVVIMSRPGIDGHR